MASSHDARYIACVRDAHSMNRRYLDSGDTAATPDVFDQALLAASAGCQAIDDICNGTIRRAFCAVRPPGHHANSIRAMGFCVFNNVAVAARYAQNRMNIERVLIIDWDIHPGNGTQEIFWEDPTVFTLSFHQEGLFQESGRPDLRGAGAGQGCNRNIPIPAGTEASAYLHMFEAVVEQIARQFEPELVLISAGFDAHRSDPASQLLLEERHFAKMTEVVVRQTIGFTGDRLVSLLEGGYNPPVLTSCVAAHTTQLCENCVPHPV